MLLALGTVLALLVFGSSRPNVVLVPDTEVGRGRIGERNTGAAAESVADEAKTMAAPPSTHLQDKEQIGVLSDKDAPGESLVSEPLNNLRPPLQSSHNERQKAVVDMFKHAWMGYTKYAWGKDILHPISRSGSNSFGMGLTLVDSLDTMWLMGLTEEFQRARDWVAQSLNVDANRNEVSVFETTIRVLGGLLAAYHLSNDHLFLQKAVSFSGTFCFNVFTDIFVTKIFF